MDDHDTNKMSDMYNVVVSDEEQYSLWPQWKPIPIGWRYGGQCGSKEECLEFIRVIWVDMRPKSIRSR